MPGTELYLPEDDGTVSDEAVLLRRIHPNNVAWDTNPLRPSSAAFTNTKDTLKMSVYIEEDLAKNGLGAEAALEDKSDHGLVGFTAGFVRSLGQRVVRAEGEGKPPGHANVVGVKDRKKKEAFHGPLTRAAQWVVQPPPRQRS